MTTHPPQSKIYFTTDTEQAIIHYNQETDLDIREKIYREKIHPALDKLVESIINRFKFPYIEERYDDIKSEVISFIVLNLHMFSEGKGKAFSYFSVVAKNYLILKNNASYKERLRSSYLSDTTNDDTVSLEEVLMVEPESETSRHDAKNFIQLLVEYWDFNLTRIFKKKKDIEVANAVVELLRRSNTTDYLNKKALYLLIREMTNYKTVHITKVLNKMRTHVFQQLKEYRQTGHISDPSTFFTYKIKK